MNSSIISSILLVVLFSNSGLADEDEAVTSIEPLTRGNRRRRFIGGEYASNSSFPYHVSLEYKYKTICSGAIISATHVLTAANCEVEDVKDLVVRAGSVQRGQGGKLHHVTEFIIHNGFTFDPKDGHDIAVIKVKKAFEFDRNCSSIEMYQLGREILPNHTVTISGFGNAAPNLQFITVPIAPCDDKKGLIPSDTFCAGHLQKNICFKDSGSPVTYGHLLAGIVSYEANCGNSPGIITKIAHYRDWITRIIYA